MFMYWCDVIFVVVVESLLLSLFSAIMMNFGMSTPGGWAWCVADRTSVPGQCRLQKGGRRRSSRQKTCHGWVAAPTQFQIQWDPRKGVGGGEVGGDVCSQFHQRLYSYTEICFNYVINCMIQGVWGNSCSQYKLYSYTKICFTYWAIQWSWFARVNVLCNLSRKKLREITAHFRADFWVGIASHCV